MTRQQHLHDANRLEALSKYHVSDNENEPALERVVELAKRIFKVPIVLISFLGRECQWVKAARGFSEKTIDLERSFCVQTIRKKGVNVVLGVPEDDARNHANSSGHDERIRFYAGAPLTTTDGYNIGTLCLIDTVPHHKFPYEAEAILVDLAAVAMQELEFRFTVEKLRVQTVFRHHLLELTQASLQELDTTFYQRLVEIAVDTIVGAQAGSLLVRHGEKHMFMAAVGFDLQALQAVEIDFGVEKHFSPDSFEPQLVKQWGTDNLDGDTKAVMRQEGRVNDIKVSLCVPIALNGQYALTLYLDNFDSPDAFDDESVEMTRVLAQQAASLMRRLELDEVLRKKKAELTQLAHYDQLTGLSNRTLFDERLSHELTCRDHNDKKSMLAVLFLDLDNFKEINDNHDHTFGDVFLTQIAACLKDCLRKEDTLARWGGDEFVVMLPNLNHADEAVEVADRLRKAVRRPISVFGYVLHTTVSIGITFCTAPARAEVLLRQADTALYEAKKVKDAQAVFDLDMTEQLRQKVALTSDLRAAVKEGGIVLHYQPRVRLADGKITSVEALARWHHPTRGWVSPAVFIPLAEEVGLIKQLGRCILDMACRQAKVWQLSGISCRVAVNLSVEQLKHADVVHEVMSTLLAHRLEPRYLELEITESTAMADVEDGMKKLQTLRELGVHLSVDDFGTAYSSLAYLQRLPLQSLKIDKSFVSDITVDEWGNADDVRIVVAIIALAKSLGLNVVAEGVETAVQRDVLKELGCDEAQGYLFVRPLPAPDVEKLLSLPHTLKQNETDQVNL